MNSDAYTIFNKYIEQKEIYDNIKNQFELKIDATIGILYELKKKYKPFSNGYEFIQHVNSFQTEWEIEKRYDEIFVDCSWEESWQYGGHDSGNFSFPLYFILDPKRFELWKQKLDKEYQEWKIKCNQSNYDKKLEQFKQLKKELNIKE